MLGELYWAEQVESQGAPCPSCAALCCAVLCLSDSGFIAATYYPALGLQWYVHTYWMDGRVDLVEILACLQFLMHAIQEFYSTAQHPRGKLQNFI